MKRKNMNGRWNRPARFTLGAAGVAALLALGGVAGAAGGPPPVEIANVPVLLVQPTDPQVLIVVPNSQSMDGDLGGAIMTGSGLTGVASLDQSSSPQTYAIPAGYTPPVDPGDGVNAPYTVKISRTFYDNSASRLNVAKESIAAVIQHYVASFDFGLMTYDTGSADLYTTWVYYMSADGGFTFGDGPPDSPPAGTKWLANPCYQSRIGYCNEIKRVRGLGAAETKPYIAVAQSSDDPDINDVLYDDTDLSDVCLDYGGHDPANPYTRFDLRDYNNGNISVFYYDYTGNCAGQTSPTNAGFVPFSDQAMYALRGFGYYVSDQSRNSGDIVVDVAAAAPGGGAPTQAQITARLRKFKAPLAAETNKPNSNEIKALAIQAPTAGLIRWADKYYTTGVHGHPQPPSNSGCTPNRYVVLVTDGLPTEDLSGDAWPPLGSAAADGYGVHATFNLSSGGTIADTDPDFEADVAAGLTTTLASTNDQAVQDTIDQLTALTGDGVQTYVVGMGAGVDPGKNPAAAATMKAMALAGGTPDYFHGDSPQAVVNDMDVIFAQIEAANMTTTTVAVDSTSYQSDESVYQAKFDTESFGWTGNVVAYPVNSDGTVDTKPADEKWDARALMQTAYAGTGWDGSRLVATWAPGTDAGVAFRWDQLTATQQGELETHWDDLTGAQQAAFGHNMTTYGQAVLDYLRGDDSKTQTNDGPFRNRAYLLGDIVYSAPLYVGAPNGVYPGSDYAGFATAKASREPVLYVGSNDGMLHAFSAATGAELFAFIPVGVFANVANLSEPSYDANHQYFVDGSPNAGDAKLSDGQWHTLLTGGLNDGGAGIYAMDVTDPTVFTSENAVASSVLWDITNATSGFEHLGLSYSQPQIAQIDCTGTNCNGSGNTFVVIFGSGYNNDVGSPWLYIVNAETGALIEALDLCSFDANDNCDGTLANGLSTPLVLSSTGSPIADRVYAGDLQGNLWRVDLSDPDPGNWSAAVLFKAQNDDGTDQPITVQPAASFAPPAAGGGIMLYFGTGQYLGLPDLTNTAAQSFYGILDRGDAPASPYAPSDLNAMTIGDTTIGGVTVRTVSGSGMDWNSQKGWRMDLPDSGERAITVPTLFAGRVIFTTFTPDTAACSAGGSSWLMTLNYATGGAFPGPEFDINGDGLLNDGDQTADGRNPVGVSMGPGYAAAPRIEKYRQGQFSDLKLVTVSVSPVKSIKERGVPPGELSWTEIR